MQLVKRLRVKSVVGLAALAAAMLPVVASAQLPVLMSGGAREVFYGNNATSTENYPPYYGTGSQGSNIQAATVRDAAGDIFFLDNNTTNGVTYEQVIEVPVSGPMQVVVPYGDAAFNCPGPPVAVNTGGFELAADPAGNLYIAHGYGCTTVTKVSRITTAGSSYGTYCVSTNLTCSPVEASVYTALANSTNGYYFQAYDIAVDGLGNAYVASSKGLLMAGPSAPGGYNLLAASTGIKGVAVDSSNNVFYADQTNKAIFEVPYTQVTNSVPVPVPIGYYSNSTGTCSGCTSIPTPEGVFLDTLGNVYASSTSSPYLVVIPNSSTGYGLTTYTVPVTISAHFASGTKGGIDNEGNFYFFNGTSIERYTGGSITIASSGNNFPGLYTASTSFPATNTYQNGSSTNPSIAFLATQTVTFNATTPAAIVNAGSLNGGAAATDYTIVSNTCTGTITVGNSCYLSLTFAATSPGTSRGSLVLYGALGTTAGNKVLSVVSMETMGTGAAVAVDPGVQTTVGKGYQAPAGIAVDGSGNMYVADPVSNAVYKYAPGSTTTGTSIGTGLSAPNGVAVDSAGDVYIADTGNDRVVMVPNELTTGLNSSDQTVVTTTGFELSTPRGVALDSIGNLYIADTGNARVLVVPTTISGSVNGGVPFALTFSTNGNPNNYAFTSPYGVAVDAYQNIYVADAGANAVWLFPSGSGFTGTTTANAGPSGVVKLTNSAGVTAFSAPTGVAVDAAGSVYVTDSGHAKIVRLPATAASYSTAPPTASTVGVDMFTNLNKPFGIATDQTADLYYTDQVSPMVAFVQRSVANGGSGVTALAFGSDTVGNTTSAQKVTLSNAGLITALSPTALPTLTSSSSPFAETATTCSTSSSLAVGSSCAFSLTFDPTATGSVTSGAGTFSFTDNAIGGTAVTQGFQLTGIGVGPVSTLTLTGPTAITYGDTATYTVTAKDSSNDVVTIPSGTAYSLSGSFSASGTLNAGGTFTLPNLVVTGSPYTFMATVNSTNSSQATVTVAKAPLYIVSANVSRLFDVANPTFATPTYAGFVNGDTTSTVVSTTASSSTTANRISPVGNYLIMPAGGTLSTFGGNNYTPTYVSGDLVITGSVPQSIFFAPLPSFTHGGTYTLTGYSSSGLPLVYGVTNGTGTATISGNTLSVTGAGTITVTAYQFGNSTYAAATTVSRSFTAQ